jgi:hypothetical protein
MRAVSAPAQIDEPRDEAHLRVAGGVEEVGAAHAVVADVVTGVDARRADAAVHVRPVLVARDRAHEVGEAAADRGGEHVADRELDRRALWIDAPRAGWHERCGDVVRCEAHASQRTLRSPCFDSRRDAAGASA